MTKLEKKVKAMSREELEVRYRDLVVDLFDAKKALYTRIEEAIIERDISDKRLWKDILLISEGFLTFQLGHIFLAQPLEPRWVNYVAAGLCLLNSAFSIVGTRIGFERTKKVMYEERKEYYKSNPEEVYAYYDEAPRFDEHIKLENIEKELKLVEEELHTKRFEAIPTDVRMNM